MRILILGPGAVGGYVGGRLAQAGRDVTFLARSSRAAHLASHGLRIGPEQEPVPASVMSEDEAAAERFDIAIVAVKAPGLDWALGQLDRRIGSESVVVPLLNGLDHLDQLANIVGPERLVPASARIVAHLDSHGDVVWQPPLATVTLGERGGGISDRVTWLGDLLRVPNLDVVVSDDIQAELWRKWSFIVALGVLGGKHRSHRGRRRVGPSRCR